jgi:glycosyltransferase involved in cell wall biosynthesis
MTDKHVIIPLLSFNASGGVRMICAVANGLAHAGITTKIVVPDYAAHSPVVVDPAVDITVLDTGRIPLQKMRYRTELIRELRREGGVAVSTGYETPFLIRLACAFGAELQMFSLIQGYEPLSHIRYGRRPFWVKPIQSLVARAGYRFKGRKVATSRFVADCIGPDRIEKVINPGIPLQFLEQIDSGNGAPRGLVTGESPVGVFPPTGKVKGIEYAVAAFANLCQKRRDVRILVYDCDYGSSGVPNFVTRYTELAAGHRRKPSLIDFYQSLDVFVYPSLVEGFGLPPLEAMACGTAVVLSDSGGVMEYAEDGRNCLVVPPGDIGAIESAVARLLDEPGLMETLVDNGRETAKRFTLDRFVEECVASIDAYIDAYATQTNKG